MASGQKRMVINTREKIISTDINRLQAFIGTQDAEELRWMLLAPADEGGAATVSGSATTPPNAMVLNGLWARPEVGTVNLFITPGVIAMVDPDAPPSADDSPCKIIVDDGVLLGGALVLTPGAGSTRIDIVECSRTTQVLETDNRDIYNPSTGLFTPASVTKAAPGWSSSTCRCATPRASTGAGSRTGTARSPRPIAR